MLLSSGSVEIPTRALLLTICVRKLFKVSLGERLSGEKKERKEREEGGEQERSRRRREDVSFPVD